MSLPLCTARFIYIRSKLVLHFRHPTGYISASEVQKRVQAGERWRCLDQGMMILMGRDSIFFLTGI